MDANLYTAIEILQGFAADLDAAQKTYAALIAAAQERVGERHAISLFENDPAYKAYRRVEHQFVRKYKGETADAESVWESIVAGEAFPSFPYVWLPTADYGWWNIENPTTRAWWVKETLLQAGWVWERDNDEWFPPSSSEEETEDD